MRGSLSRPEQDEHGTAQTSLRRHPPKRSARRPYAVAPIPTGSVALRQGGPRGTTGVPPSVLTGPLPIPDRGSPPFPLAAAADSPGAHRGGLRPRAPRRTEAAGGPARAATA